MEKSSGNLLGAALLTHMPNPPPHRRPSPQRGRTAPPEAAGQRLSTGEVLARGLLAGAAGVAAMTLAEKIEHRTTRGRFGPMLTVDRPQTCPDRPQPSALTH